MLATYSTGSIGYYLCLFMKTQFQLGSYMHGCTNEHTFSNKSTRFNPYFDSYKYREHKLAKVGIKSYIFARECVFIFASMVVTTQLELCFHEQTQIVANAACRVGS